jgi:hypothetical protein
MPSATTKGVIAAATATGIVAAGIVAILTAGGGSSPRFDTSLDASSNAVPPIDWRAGYTRTGTICYSQDATGTTSECFAANVLPHTTDATDVGWPIEPAQTNRIPINQGGACGGAPWVCSTATMDSTTVAPDGTATASTITMGGGSVDATAFGYTNSTALDLRMYVKCSSGTLDASNIGGAGHWTVNCATVGGTWRLLESSADSAVTEVQAWQSKGDGKVRLRLSGADAAIWQITATEALGYARSTRYLGTVPTSDATGSTVGATAWTVDNSTGAYWAASGVTKTETGTIHNGTCWSYTAPTITLSGASTCHGIRYALGLSWSY